MKPKEMTVTLKGVVVERLEELAGTTGLSREVQLESCIQDEWFDTMRELDMYEQEYCSHDTLVLVDDGGYKCRWCGKAVKLAEEDTPF
jgi:hypothetical protein